MFTVAAIHFTRTCNLSCPFCYRAGSASGAEKPRDFFIELVDYLVGLTPQIALGGGEPFLDPGFVAAMGRACARSRLVLNVTTNGHPVLDMTDAALAVTLANVTMVSVSFDREKWGRDITRYASVVRRIGDAGAMVGANLLVDPSLLHGDGSLFIKAVAWLFEVAGVDRVFALHPKCMPSMDIRLQQHAYRLLTTLYPGFCVDDLTRQVLTFGYGGWREPCHYGTMLSVDECGFVAGCSFEKRDGARLDRPSDVRRLAEQSFEPRFSCPFVSIPGGEEPWNLTRTAQR
jgi:organic radical activating enzyme